MSGREKAMMRTRCPVCGTVFRVTSEQLRLKAGKVRCGHCRGVFNAFDQLLTDETTIASQSRPISEKPASPPACATAEAKPAAEAKLAAETPAAPKADDPPTPPAPAAAPADLPGDAPAKSAPRRAPPPAADALPASEESPPPAAPPPGKQAKTRGEKENWPETEVLVAESPEQSTQAAREAGLVAAREWAETPAYNRWAAGALASEASGFDPEAGRRALWPFVIAALLLMLILGAQLAHHFRTEVVRALPTTADYYDLLGIPVPLPREAERVAIESSDLQFDSARGQFVLQATLHNRAPYAQDWPALELTLTDAGDKAVARRVMMAAEYLPPAISPERFPANGEVAVRLWIEAREPGAAGYRLYVFYP